MKDKFTFTHVDKMTGREMFCVARLRNETFVAEQKITLPDLDEIDLTAVQVFLLNSDKTNALATCRVFEDPEYGWMFGRVTVSKAARGQHLGAEMMHQVHAFLRKKGVEKVTCHAQMTAKPFYEHLGYQTEGSIFDEGGVDHIMMIKNL